MRQLKCFVLQHSVIKTKHWISLIRGVIRGFEWVEILGFCRIQSFWQNYKIRCSMCKNDEKLIGKRKNWIIDYCALECFARSVQFFHPLKSWQFNLLDITAKVLWLSPEVGTCSYFEKKMKKKMPSLMQKWIKIPMRKFLSVNDTLISCTSSKIRHPSM